MKSLDSEYLLGNLLIGDDYTQAQILEWFEAEMNSYHEMVAERPNEYRYEYHQLNKLHLYNHINLGHNLDLLGFGSATGSELLPLATKARTLTIIEPGNFSPIAIEGIDIRKIKPSACGTLAIPSNSIDVATCFGVLHHIPNVTYLLSELFRVLKPNGYLLLREPIVSMGDWNNPRKGLTKRERGIPYQLLTTGLARIGFTVTYSSVCDFSPAVRLAKLLGLKTPFNNYLFVRLDQILSRTFFWNYKYHQPKKLSKIAPSSAAFVCKKMPLHAPRS